MFVCLFVFYFLYCFCFCCFFPFQVSKSITICIYMQVNNILFKYQLFVCLFVSFFLSFFPSFFLSFFVLCLFLFFQTSALFECVYQKVSFWEEQLCKPREIHTFLHVTIRFFLQMDKQEKSVDPFPPLKARIWIFAVMSIIHVGWSNNQLSDNLRCRFRQLILFDLDNKLCLSKCKYFTNNLGLLLKQNIDASF